MARPKRAATSPTDHGGSPRPGGAAADGATADGATADEVEVDGVAGEAEGEPVGDGSAPSRGAADRGLDFMST
ncbi:hypothetical protein GCM10009719_33830 [Nocardioides kribbensis]